MYLLVYRHCAPSPPNSTDRFYIFRVDAVAARSPSDVTDNQTSPRGHAVAADQRRVEKAAKLLAIAKKQRQVIDETLD